MTEFKTEDLLKTLSFLKSGASDIIPILDDFQELLGETSKVITPLQKIVGKSKDILQRVKGMKEKE